MDFSINEFINVVIPYMLIKNKKEKYYVKGGRVHDMYFKSNFNPSIDWDIVGTTGFIKYIKVELENYAKSKNLTLIKKVLPKDKCVLKGDLVQFGFKTYFYDESKDPYFMDILVVNSSEIYEEKYFIIDEIKIMNLNDFFEDLIVTQKNRYILIRNILTKFIKKIIEKSIEGKEEQRIKEILHLFEIYIFNKTEKYLAIQELLSEILGKEFKALKYDFEFKELNESTINYITKNIKHPEKYKKITLSSNEEIIIDGLINLISKYKILIKNISNKSNVLNKFLKTRKRYENIINYDWNNLTDKYKLILMLNCKSKPNFKEQIFNISETCNSYLDCKEDFKIVKNTDGCVEEEEKYTFMDFENYFKK